MENEEYEEPCPNLFFRTLPGEVAEGAVLRNCLASAETALTGDSPVSSPAIRVGFQKRGVLSRHELSILFVHTAGGQAQQPILPFLSRVTISPLQQNARTFSRTCWPTPRKNFLGPLQ